MKFFLINIPLKAILANVVSFIWVLIEIPSYIYVLNGSTKGG